jgi:hypothetical protein
MAFRFPQRIPRWRARKTFPIYLEAPAYSPRSGGIRAMHALYHHLNRLGYEAFVIWKPPVESAPIPPRYVNMRTRLWHWCRGREPIVVYPEVIAGNPHRAKFVVRYLLNKPGLLVPGSESSFASDDYFIDGAREHAPNGVRSFDLFMPLVDHSIYFPPPAGALRHGFAVFAHRAEPDPATFPQWLKPCVALSMQSPRSHAELGDIYRRSRALVVWERSIAIFEALSCGCPVICIANDRFNDETYHPRFRDAGLIWGWRESELDAAVSKTSSFRAIHRDLENSLDERIRLAFDSIIEDAWRRLCRESPARQAMSAGG